MLLPRLMFVGLWTPMIDIRIPFLNQNPELLDWWIYQLSHQSSNKIHSYPPHVGDFSPYSHAFSSFSQAFPRLFTCSRARNPSTSEAASHGGRQRPRATDDLPAGALQAGRLSENRRVRRWTSEKGGLEWMNGRVRVIFRFFFKILMIFSKNLD